LIFIREMISPIRRLWRESFFWGRREPLRETVWESELILREATMRVALSGGGEDEDDEEEEEDEEEEDDEEDDDDPSPPLLPPLRLFCNLFCLFE
jgi:hypothetical protein